MGVTVNAGGVLTQHVDILVPIGVPQPAAFAAYDGEWER